MSITKTLRKNWIEHVAYACDQYMHTKNVFLQDTPPKNGADYIQWNAIVESFMRNSGVLALFFTIGYKPDDSQYLEPIREDENKDAYYMRQFNTDFTLAATEYDKLRDWQEVVEHTVYRLSAKREKMLKDRLSKGRDVVDILDPLVASLDLSIL